MKITSVQTNGTALETGVYMHQMVRKYYHDMLPWAGLSLQEIYDVISNIPFRPDPETEEVIMRPRYTMSMRGYGGDCDDFAIALASWAYLNGIPYRFVAVRKPDRNVLHHVYPELYINNRWVTADATYNINTLGYQREHYVEHVILPEGSKS